MKDKRKFLLLLVVAIALAILYLVIGLNSRNWDFALSLRVPKLVAIIITGAAIAYSTAIFQTITNNRILTPSIMGLDSMYILLQTVVLFSFGSTSVLVINSGINFGISLVGMIGFALVLTRFLFRREDNSIYFLLLVGLITGSLFQSLASFMQMVIDPNEFLVLQNRMFASFNNVNTNLLVFALVLMVAVGLYARRYSHVLDVVALGRDQAINLGVNYDEVIQKLMIIVAILVSLSTALVGPITFLGLLVVNLGRQFIKSYRHSHLIIASILLSIIALVGGQLLIERLLNFGTPISVIINLIGGLYFIYLLLKENRQ